MSYDSEYSKIYLEAEKAYENDEMALAISLFSSLAECDVPGACLYLGLIYKTGDGVAVDKKYSQYWYSRYVFLLNKLSIAGDMNATLTLGKLYQYGDMVAKNETKALDFVKKAANAGLPEAQFHLANLFLYGWSGCIKSEYDYQYWLNQAVTNKYPEAMYQQGAQLITGSVDDRISGIGLIKQAAELGFWPAVDWLKMNA